MFSRVYLVGSAFLLSACKFVFLDGGAGGYDGWGEETGGTTTNGVGGYGGTDEVGGSGFGGAGTGGDSGGQCVSAYGEGYVESECDQMDISSITTCPNTLQAPFAIDVCHRAFQLFNEGTREALLYCLRDLPADLEVACYDVNETATVACIDQVYESACPSPSVEQFCDDTQAACDGAGQISFDVANCKADLAVYSQQGLEAYVTCFNHAPQDVGCEQIHDYCMNEIAAL